MALLKGLELPLTTSISEARAQEVLHGLNEDNLSLGQAMQMLVQAEPEPSQLTEQPLMSDQTANQLLALINYRLLLQ